MPSFGGTNCFGTAVVLGETTTPTAQQFCTYYGKGGGIGTEMWHQGGPGADSHELLYVMTKWVEGNAEPGSRANPVLAWKQPAGGPAGVGSAVFSRPLCPYPEHAEYVGGRRGNPALAENFACRKN